MIDARTGIGLFQILLVDDSYQTRPDRIEEIMKKNIKKVAIISGVVITVAICLIIVWSKMEAIKAKKLVNEFNEKIQKGELIPRESVKLHLGDFIVFKHDKDIFALKMMDLKTSGFKYEEALFDCYSQPVSTKKIFNDTSKHTHGKVRKLFHKKKADEYYEDTSNADRLIECGNILFDWSPGDEHDYAWLAIEKIISGSPTLEYSLTNIKDISMLDLKSQSLKWKSLKK